MMIKAGKFYFLNLAMTMSDPEIDEMNISTVSRHFNNYRIFIFIQISDNL